MPLSTMPYSVTVLCAKADMAVMLVARTRMCLLRNCFFIVVSSCRGAALGESCGRNASWSLRWSWMQARFRSGFPCCLAVSHGDPVVLGIVLKMPSALVACHDAPVVVVVAIRDNYRWIAARHHHDVMVFDCHRLIEIAFVGIHTLERETLRGV